MKTEKQSKQRPLSLLAFLPLIFDNTAKSRTFKLCIPTSLPEFKKFLSEM